MSTAPWTEPHSGYAAPLPSRPERPRLVLVPTGSEVAAAPLRVTRLGRLVITTSVAMAVVAAVAIGAPGWSRPPAAQTTVTIGSGQTLSEIAAAALPGMSINEGVAELQIANNLDTDQVTAGQRLVVPKS